MQVYRKKKRKKRCMTHIIILLVILYVGGIFINQRLKLHQLSQDKVMLEKKILELKKEEASLEEEKQKKDDPEYIEKIAREQLKMVKPNEIIYIDVNKAKYEHEKIE